MPTILLVRHGQASFGGPDYDVLSALGREQSDAVAGELAARRLTVARLISGTLTRQRDTAAPVAARLDMPVAVDPRFDEYDMVDILSSHSDTDLRPSRSSGKPVSSAAFQDVLEQALERWITTGSQSPAAERHPAFTARVGDGLRAAADGLPSGSTALVFTSGGVVAAISAALLGLPDSALITFNRVAINAGITKIVTGRSGVTLVSFNEHGHLERDGRSLVSYR